MLWSTKTLPTKSRDLILFNSFYIPAIAKEQVMGEVGLGASSLQM
jgi:hypothetical protein